MPKGVLYVETYPASAEQEAAYNSWYSDIHLAEVVRCPGFVSARRFAPSGLGDPYVAIYEMDSDDLQRDVDFMLAIRQSGGFTSSDAMMRPPAVRLHTTIAEYLPNDSKVSPR